MLTRRAAGLCLVLVLLGGGSAASGRLASGGALALLVTAPGSPGESDRAMRARLESLGYRVETRTSQGLSAEDLASAALVVVSRAAAPEPLPAKLRDAAVPVVVSQPQPALYHGLGFTGPAAGIDHGTGRTTGEVLLPQAAHPLAAGLWQRATVVQPGSLVAWALPAGEPIVAASLAGDVNRSLVFAFEVGAPMWRGTAPARRVAFGPGAGTHLTRDGWRLWIRAVEWAATPNVAPRVDAGPNLEVAAGAEAVLDGRVADDGLPEGRSVSVQWSQVGGPSGAELEGDASPMARVRPRRPGTYTFRIHASDGRLAASDEVRVTARGPAPVDQESPPPPGVTVPPGTGLLMIVGNATSLTAGDSALRARLETVGYTVTVKTGVTYTSADLVGKSAVLITATAVPADVNTKLKAAPLGVVTLRPQLLDDMALTGATSAVDYGNAASQTTLEVVAPADVLAAGLGGPQAVTTSAAGFTWGVPAGGVTVATISGNPARATVFRFLAGDPMYGSFTAPGRRVGLFVSEAAASRLSAPGTALLDAAVHWSAGLLNGTPSVQVAPPPAALLCPATITLDGSATDDGPAPLSFAWTQTSGPGSVSFGTPDAEDTTACFSSPGTYVVRLTVTDASAASGQAEAAVNVYAANGAPAVDAGPDQAVSLTDGAVLAGSVSDDGLPHPPGAVTLQWSRLSGPGGVDFGDAASASTTARFTTAGTYVLRLLATDGERSAFDDLTVAVEAAALLVVDAAGAQPSDLVVKAALEAHGFTVQVQPCTSSECGSAVGKALVVVAPTASATAVANRFRAVATPVVGMLLGAWDNLGITNGTSRGTVTGQTEAVILDPTHPIAVPLFGTLSVTTSPASFSYGAPGTGGVKVARAVGNARPTVIAYEKGSQMVGLKAPARRVGFGFGTDALGSLYVAGSWLLERTILWAADTNRMPLVDAGPDQVLSNGFEGILWGAASDDDEQTPSFTTTWSLVSGPGTATFTYPSSVYSPVSFSDYGLYTLRLTASDGRLTAFDDVTVLVNAAPVVDAGPHQTVTLPAAAVLDGTVVDGTVPGTLTASWSQTLGPGTAVFADPGAADTTVAFSTAGTYVLRLTVSDGTLASFDETTVTVRTGGSPPVLLVTAEAPSPSDDAVEARLAALGFAVTRRAGSIATPPDADGASLVFVSGTVDPAVVGATFRGVSAPVLVAHPQLYDDMKMTGTLPGAHFGSTPAQTLVTIQDPDHRLAAGLSGTLAAAQAGSEFGWGHPEAGAAWVVSTSGSGGRSAVFGYEPGASMAGMAAPARRTGFFAASDTPTRLTAAGWALLEAAVDWTLGRVGAPVFTPGAGTFTTVPVVVGMSSATSGVEIHYTTDGSEPSSASPLYTAPIAIGTTTTVKAIAIHTLDGETSGVSTGIYRISLGTLSPPVISPAAGDYPSLDLEVSLSAAPGDAIRFTLDGSVPTEDSPSYTAPFRVSEATTVTARAFRTDWTASAPVSAAFTFDPDQDGLSNSAEDALGTDPLDADTNDDGVSDGTAVLLGLSPTDLDMDDDGLTNAQEAALGTDPFVADTDGDGVGDATDAFPLDPTRWELPPGDPADTTPPVIVLQEPAGAELVSSVP